MPGLQGDGKGVYGLQGGKADVGPEELLPLSGRQGGAKTGGGGPAVTKPEPVLVSREVITRTETIVRTVVGGKFIFIERKEVKQVSSMQ